MKKEELKKEIIASIDVFLNINFDDFIKNVATVSNSQIDEGGAREAIDHIRKIFTKIKSDPSTLNIFTIFKLAKIKITIADHANTITSQLDNSQNVFNHLNAMDDQLSAFKLDEIIKKIDFTDTERAVNFFKDNKKLFEDTNAIFEQAIKNKDDLIKKNLSTKAFNFNERKKEIKYIIDIENNNKNNKNSNIKNNEKKSSWRGFLNLRSFWWFALGLFFAVIALGLLGFLWYIQFTTKSDVTTGDALLRISSVIILMTLSSFCFLQFSNNKKLIEFYEFKIIALSAFESLYQNHSSDPVEKSMLFTRAFDVIFREYSFKDSNVKNLASHIKDFKE